MTAFRASYADLKVIKTRQCVQVIFELPIADFDAAYEILGGLPNSSVERWFGIAALRSEKEVVPSEPKSISKSADTRPDHDNPIHDRAKRGWRDLGPAQQAGIRCEEPSFAAFLKEQRSDDWHESQDAAACVRLICGVSSRALIEKDHRSRMIWKQLDDSYQAWKALEHA